jgi:hypothetical protein
LTCSSHRSRSSRAAATSLGAFFALTVPAHTAPVAGPNHGFYRPPLKTVRNRSFRRGSAGKLRRLLGGCAVCWEVAQPEGKMRGRTGRCAGRNGKMGAGRTLICARPRSLFPGTGRNRTESSIPVPPPRRDVRATAPPRRISSRAARARWFIVPEGAHPPRAPSALPHPRLA